MSPAHLLSHAMPNQQPEIEIQTDQFLRAFFNRSASAANDVYVVLTGRQ